MDCHSYSIEYGTPRCMGTKEMEPCYCNGNTDSCSFYPEKRKAKNPDVTKPIMTRKEAEALLGVKIVD